MIRFIPVVLILFLVCNSCHISYSLSDASIPAEMKTVEVPYFQNHARIVQTMLARNLTEKLKDKILSQTSAKVVNNNGDAIFEGEITDYNVTAAAITGDNTATKNRLTITVKVRYANKKDGKYDYEQSFSRYADFSSSQSVESVENDLIDTIGDLLIDDIFNKAFSNW